MPNIPDGLKPVGVVLTRNQWDFICASLEDQIERCKKGQMLPEKLKEFSDWAESLQSVIDENQHLRSIITERCSAQTLHGISGMPPGQISALVYDGVSCETGQQDLQIDSIERDSPSFVTIYCSQLGDNPTNDTYYFVLDRRACTLLRNI